MVVSDYWPSDVLAFDITVKDVLALSNKLELFRLSIKHSRVDVHVDSLALFHPWNGQSAKSNGLVEALKSIFNTTLECNCVLRIFNVLALPTRQTILIMLDSSLSKRCWDKIQDAFRGEMGHSVDLMALRLNVVSDRSGKPLPFFSPWRSPEYVGVNLFTQFSGHHSPDLFRSPYVFPPIFLIPNVLKLLHSARLTFTLVVPDVQLQRFWWPLLPHKSSSSLRLGFKGEKDIIRFPSKNGYVESSTLPCDLWAFCVEYTACYSL